MLRAGLAKIGLVVVHWWEGWGVVVVLAVFEWGRGSEVFISTFPLLLFRVSKCEAQSNWLP